MKKQDIEFKVRKDTLRGSLFIPSGKGPFPGVIYFHGNGGNGEKYYEWGDKFAKRGILSLAFNFRGCGRSEGDYFSQTHQDAFEDAKTAFKFLLKQNVDPNKIGIIGGSFGGFIAAMILPEIITKSLVLLSPSAHDDPKTTKLDIGPLEKEIEYFADKNNWLDSVGYKNIANFTGRLLVIKSENDENVPAFVVDRYFEKAVSSSKKEMRIIKGADHRLSTQRMRDNAFRLMLNWFLETL